MIYSSRLLENLANCELLLRVQIRRNEIPAQPEGIKSHFANPNRHTKRVNIETLMNTRYSAICMTLGLSIFAQRQTRQGGARFIKSNLKSLTVQLKTLKFPFTSSPNCILHVQWAKNFLIWICLSTLDPISHRKSPNEDIKSDSNITFIAFYCPRCAMYLVPESGQKKLTINFKYFRVSSHVSESQIKP